MRFVPKAVTRAVGSAVLNTKQQSPHILFGIGVIGVVATAVMASKATLKLSETVDEIEKEVSDVRALEHSVDYDTREAQKDMAYVYGRSTLSIIKLYGPTIIVGVSTVACLAGSHKILTNRNAALVSAYAAIDRAFREYRKRVVDEYGEDKDRELRYGSVTKEMLVDGPKGQHKIVDVKRVDPNGISGYARFFDETSTEWKRDREQNLLFVKCQQNWANDLLQSRGHVFLNEVYDWLGLERSKAGAVVGWYLNQNGDNFVDFGVFNGNNPKARDFVNGIEGSILLDFNVDGVIFDKIERFRR